MATRDVTPWSQRGSQLRRSGGPAGDLTSLFNSLHDQIERAFNNVWGGLEAPFGEGRRVLAATDISESEEGYEICVELPGFDEKDIDVSVDDESLIIKAETSQETKEGEKKGYVYSERRRGSVYRTLPLPPSADLAKITGAFVNGVLTIKVPKSEKAKRAARKIPLSSKPNEPGAADKT
jgi:HSP20 family protein